MTRKEWIEKNLPAYVSNKARGGVIGCPNWYRELTRMDPGILVDWPCKACHEENPLHMCEECWNMELNIKEERKKTMTRKEWMLENHPNAVGDGFRGGVLSCPGEYRDLVDIDPSATGLNSVKCSMNPDCTTCWNTALPTDEICAECWNQEIPETTETRPHGFRLEKMEKAVKEADLSIKEAIDRATCDCDTCAHQDLCRFECQFREMTKEMYRHCIEETARYNIPELGIQMRPLHCKRYESSPTIEDLNTAVFHLKAQHLTDEMVRKIFDEENKRWTL